MSSTDKKAHAPERRIFPQGTTIFKEGERGDEAYILESGNIQIFKTIGGRRVALGTIHPWGIFGELALIDDNLRMATAYAEEDSVCLVLTKISIAQMLDESPRGLRVLITSMANTIRNSGDDLAEARFLLNDRTRE